MTDAPETAAPEATTPETETTEAAAPEAAAPASNKPTRPFRKRFVENRLSPESAARQGRVTQFAWEKLGGLAGAAEFLNHHDEALGGRPLDLAVASAAGLEAVEQAIVARAANAG